MLSVLMSCTTLSVVHAVGVVHTGVYIRTKYAPGDWTLNIMVSTIQVYSGPKIHLGAKNN